MINLARYKGVVLVGLGLLCAFFLVNASLFALFGSDPEVFNDPEHQLVWDHLERTGQQIARAELILKDESPDKDRPLGVVLGQSTTLRGIDRKILNAQVKPRHRWFVVTGYGSSFVKLRYYAQTLIASNLHPNTIVLGLHETMLVGLDRADDEAVENAMIAQSAPQADPETFTGMLSRMMWVTSQRSNVSYYVNMTFYETRLALHSELGTGAAGIFKPADNAWVTLQRNRLSKRRPDRFIESKKKLWQSFGWFDPENYTTTNRHADALRDLVKDLNTLEPRQIVVVIMPVSSDLRQWVGQEPVQVLKTLIDDLDSNAPILTLDLRDAMPDEYFTDNAHLNFEGQKLFSEILAEKLTAMKLKK